MRHFAPGALVVLGLSILAELLTGGGREAAAPSPPSPTATARRIPAASTDGYESYFEFELNDEGTPVSVR